MPALKPPPVPRRRRDDLGWDGRIVLTLSIALIIAVILIGPVFNLILLTKLPTGSMQPTIMPGDSLVVEGFSYLRRKPKRGEIVTFRTRGLPKGIPQDQLYIKRIVGLPGERVAIAGGTLFIDGSPVLISNAAGRISFDFPLQSMFVFTNVTLTENQYFVIGDNTTNSLDSRVFGPIQRSNILGRHWFTYDHGETNAQLLTFP
jgi:signal peptidase I